MINEKPQLLTIEKTNQPALVSRSIPALLALTGQAARVLSIALWFALLTGLAEVSLLTIARVFLHRYVNFMNYQMVWMSPLADTFLFVTIAVIWIVVSRYLPRFMSLRAATFVVAFLAFLTILLLYQALHVYAALLIAGGLAFQIARFAASHVDGFTRFVGQTTPWLVVVVVLLAAGTSGWKWWANRQAVLSLPAAKSDAPNVLLIVLDAVRARNLSLYGYTRRTTPRLEEMARTGIVFESAISTAPWTLPSHASMFTGRYPHELSTGFAAGLDSTYPTLAEELSRHGYLTAGFVANTWFCGPASGLSRGFTHYEDIAISPGQIMVSSAIGRAASDSPWLRRTINYSEELGRKNAPEINESFLRWLSGKDPKRPFFAFLNYFDAHEPYLPPDPFATKFGSSQPRPNPRHSLEWNWAPSEIQLETNAYDGSIAYLDHQIGALLDELKSRGLLDNTLVIITGDHGEEFGEHGIVDHGYSVYLPSLQVPLLISYPRMGPGGIRVKEPVTLRDLPATVLDLLELKNTNSFPGNSLARRWMPAKMKEGSVSEPVLSELEFAANLPASYPISKGEMKSLVIDQYHYIRNGDKVEELYDFQQDPLETRNLALSDESRSILNKCREYLDSGLSRKSELNNRTDMPGRLVSSIDLSPLRRANP